MAADAADRLRALARDHAEGRLTLSAYRRLRTPMLDALVGVAVEPSPDVTQPRGSSRPTAADRAPAADPPPWRGGATMTERASGPQPGGHGRHIAAIAVILGSVAILLAWRHALQRRAPPAVPAAASGRAAEGADPIRALLQPLIDNPDWSDARLTALDGSLLEAGSARIAAAQSAGWFNAFVDQVRSRVKEQEALEGAALDPGTSPLAALAVTLGIDLASPDRPIRIAAASERTAPPAAPPAAPAATGAPERRARPEVSDAVRKGDRPSSGAGHGAAAAGSVAAGTAAHVQSVSGHAQGVTTSAANGSLPAVAGPRRASAVPKLVQCSAALTHSRHTYCQDALSTGALGPLLAVIPPGSFQMGNGEVAAERPVHRVTIARPFAMSVYEISQGEFRQYCQATGKPCPAQPWAVDDDPVVEVSWNDAREYTHWLSQATGQIYRLPTEAEWEYAARAGRTGLYPSGDSLSPTDAYFSMAETLTAPARRSQPFNANAWRLLHMVGNVREWVDDGWSPSYSGAPSDGSAWQGGSAIKVVRGGCYADRAIELRLTTRAPLSAETRDRFTGIRIVREIR